MTDFNLIPNEYTAAVRLRRTTRMALGACVTSLLILGLLLAAFQHYVGQREAELHTLQQQHAMSIQQQQRMAALVTRRDSLNGQALLLNSLRAGRPFGEIANTVESALEDTEVWLTSWVFRRQGILVEDEPLPHQPSYFVVAKDPKDFPKSWEHLTHMTIQGEAKDHAALSSFVQGLFAQSNVDDVRVQHSERRDASVRFTLAVVVKNPGQAA